MSASNQRRMAATVMVRLPLSLAERVQAAASTADLSAAAWLRSLAVDALVDAPADLARPSPPRQAPPPPAPEHVRILADLAHRLGELGGAMVQAAIVSRQDGRTVLHAEIEAALPDVRAASSGVLKAIKRAWPTP